MMIRIRARSHLEAVPMLRHILDNYALYISRKQELLKARDMQNQEMLKFIDSQRSGITEFQKINQKEIEEIQQNIPKGYTPSPMPTNPNFYKPTQIKNYDGDDE